MRNGTLYSLTGSSNEDECTILGQFMCPEAQQQVSREEHSLIEEVDMM